jgi:hypothetical protein
LGEYIGIYTVLLEFPEEGKEDPNLDWLADYRLEVEGFCGECCFKIGNFHILPEPYFPVLDRFLKEASSNYRRRGYNPIFKVLRTLIHKIEFKSLRHLILNHIVLNLEKGIKNLEDMGHAPSSVIQKVSKEVVKANESVFLFQLEKYFPEKMDRLYDLINIISEKIAEHEANTLGPVVVTEL